MTKYILKRLLYIAIVFTVIGFLMFYLYNLIPGDPARAELESRRQELIKSGTYEQEYQAARERLGLNDPMIARFGKWFGNLITGDFGTSSFYKTEVVNVIKEPMKTTIFINIFSTILALAITIPLGIRCAVKRGSKFDNAVQVSSIVGYSIPIYIIALIMIYLFCVLIQIFPVSGIKTPGSSYTGLRAFVDKLYYIALPLIVMTMASLGGMTRYVRASMIEALSMDYVRTARAKGLREKVVIYSHAWRNALLPVITLVIGWFLSIFSGSIIIETTFALNGMGVLYYNGLTNQDYELVLAMQMFYTVVSLVGILLTDLSYGLVDPRVRVDK
ncbi:MAG: ABC transporter permease [Clostridiales bacterium]|nr:MAG: ABC transporter permease [Clostridiales bacterium]